MSNRLVFAGALTICAGGLDRGAENLDGCVEYLDGGVEGLAGFVSDFTVSVEAFAGCVEYLDGVEDFAGCVEDLAGCLEDLAVSVEDLAVSVEGLACFVEVFSGLASGLAGCTRYRDLGGGDTDESFLADFAGCDAYLDRLLGDLAGCVEDFAVKVEAFEGFVVAFAGRAGDLTGWTRYRDLGGGETDGARLAADLAV